MILNKLFSMNNRSIFPGTGAVGVASGACSVSRITSQVYLLPEPDTVATVESCNPGD